MAKGDAGTRAGKASGGDNTAAKRKRKRKTQLPKNFDPENPGPPPDPERWLPKWQRTEYKKKRRNRKVSCPLGPEVFRYARIFFELIFFGVQDR